MENYQYIKEIGRGSFGEVWLVRCANTNKKYVLKRIDFQRASPREQKAAYQEAKLLSTLKHPNIVSYLDSFHNSEGSLFIVMGYCEFGDLYTYIRNRNGVYFEEEQIINWFVQICMALKYLHDKNILHRDLKTQNIFVTKHKLIKVGDLGIARILKGKQDMATTLVGTPYYMSPEIFSSKPYNQKSDVWALGCCIYEIATLKHAFNAHDLHSLMQKVLKGKVFVTSERYSPEFWRIVSSMLDHEPQNRPTITEMLLNDYIRTYILFFLKDCERSKSVSCDSSRENQNCSKSECFLPFVPDHSRKSIKETANCHYVKKMAKRIPDINGNGDGNDNSQEMREIHSSGRTCSIPKVISGKKYTISEVPKKKSASVNLNNSCKENMNPTNYVQITSKSTQSSKPDTPSKNSVNSFKLLNNITYTLKNTRLDFRKNFEMDIPKSSPGLLYSKGNNVKLLERRQSVSANTNLACSKRDIAGSGCRRNLEFRLNELPSQNIHGGLLKEIMECNVSEKGINSAARQRRRELKKQKAKNELDVTESEILSKGEQS